MPLSKVALYCLETSAFLVQNIIQSRIGAYPVKQKRRELGEFHTPQHDAHITSEILKSRAHSLEFARLRANNASTLRYYKKKPYAVELRLNLLCSVLERRFDALRLCANEVFVYDQPNQIKVKQTLLQGDKDVFPIQYFVDDQPTQIKTLLQGDKDAFPVQCYADSQPNQHGGRMGGQPESTPVPNFIRCLSRFDVIDMVISQHDPGGVCPGLDHEDPGEDAQQALRVVRHRVSLKLENGWIDLANFGLELFVEFQGRSKGTSHPVIKYSILKYSTYEWWAKLTTEWSPLNVNRCRGRPKRRWRDELNSYDKDWPQKALNREEWKEGREAFALQWDNHG
uniref:SFRICE_001349 n=1 Tax=Spodoptera frugiperda TaxID=7108 RepID=A0A2H1V8S1_SPOFR